MIDNLTGKSGFYQDGGEIEMGGGGYTVTRSSDRKGKTHKVTGPDGTLELKAERTRGGLLHAPLHKNMHRRVEETMDSTVEIKLLDKNNVEIVKGTGTAAALEIFGELEKLLAYKK